MPRVDVPRREREPDAAPQAIALSRPALTLLAAAWLTATANLPFWRSAWHATSGIRADDALFLFSLPVVVLAWTFLLLSLIAWGRATKAILAVVLLASATAGYFMEAYGVMLDDSMVNNVIQTHAAEAMDLLTWRLWAWLAAFGALPAAAILRARVIERPWPRELGVKLLGMAIAAACLAAILFTNYQHYATLLRNHRELRFLLVPHNIVTALHGRVKSSLAAPATLQAVGTDARRSGSPAGRPSLIMVVVGETARAANFSLNGYPRPTNVELARRNVISFANVSACGTSTAVSLPCMFLDVGRGGFDSSLAAHRESLLDVLHHAGIAVRWRDNNAGCKGVCDRVPHDDLSRMTLPDICRGGECRDEVLLHGIPYALAPREQVQVPLLLWLSDGMRGRDGIDVACLEAKRLAPISHDYLFHSIVGLANVRTAVYRPERDLFRGCRS